jgi:hypothetical protein
MTNNDEILFRQTGKRQTWKKYYKTQINWFYHQRYSFAE